MIFPKISRHIFFFLALMTSFLFAKDLSMYAENTSAKSRGNISLQPNIAESAIDSTYKLGPGDFLDLFIENAYFSVQVNPDQTIIIDEVGAIDVGGLPFYEAKKIILEKLSSRYNTRYCYVQLSKLKSFKINVMGAVKNVGQFIVEPQTRVSTFFRNISGFLPVSDVENILLVREGDSLKVNLDKISREGLLQEDLLLEQGDFLFVPYQEIQDVVTLVIPDARIALAYKEGLTIRDYYVKGFGNTIENGGYVSIVVKDSSGTEKRVPVSSADVIKPTSGMEIQFVDQRGTDEFVYVGGAVAAMGKVPYNPDFKALDYIAASGVTPITGSWDQVRVVRGNRKTLDVNATEDVILPGDFIEIPKSTYESFKDFTMFLASLLTVVSSSFILYMNYK